jgi:hypothetical protein
MVQINEPVERLKSDKNRGPATVVKAITTLAAAKILSIYGRLYLVARKMIDY